MQENHGQSNYFIRAYDLTPHDKLTTPIDVIGCGAIGSFAALTLAKMGFTRLTLWDHDRVAPENIGPQLFRIKDIGRLKVDALADILQDFTGCTPQKVPYKANGTATFSDIVIVAVDSMAARKCIFRGARAQSRFFLDPRMGAENALLYALRLSDEYAIDRYKKTLYTDEQASTAPCTAKATAYTANMLGGHVAKTVIDLLARREYAPAVQWNIRANDYASKLLAN